MFHKPEDFNKHTLGNGTELAQCNQQPLKYTELKGMRFIVEGFQVALPSSGVLVSKTEYLVRLVLLDKWRD